MLVEENILDSIDAPIDSSNNKSMKFSNLLDLYRNSKSMTIDEIKAHPAMSMNENECYDFVVKWSAITVRALTSLSKSGDKTKASAILSELSTLTESALNGDHVMKSFSIPEKTAISNKKSGITNNLTGMIYIINTLNTREFKFGGKLTALNNKGYVMNKVFKFHTLFITIYNALKMALDLLQMKTNRII